MKPFCLISALGLLLAPLCPAAVLDIQGVVQASNNPGLIGFTFSASLDYNQTVVGGATTGLATFTGALQSLSINGGPSTSFSGATQNLINYTRGGSPAGDHVGLNISVGGDIYALDFVFNPATLGSGPYSLADLSSLTPGHFSSGTFTSNMSGLTADGAITSFVAPSPSPVPEPSSPLVLAFAFAATFFTVKGGRFGGRRE